MSGVATAAGPVFFVLGVWVQPIATMDTWKLRGVNTVVEVPQGHDVLQWSKAANTKGLYEIRQASSDLRYDVNDPRLLAWSSLDEPSNTTTGQLVYGAVAQDPAELMAQVAPWRAAAAAEGKFVPVWTNHVANHIWPSFATNNTLMRDYMAGGESDWLSADAYPIQERQALVVQAAEGYTSTIQGITMDRQIEWSGGKPVMAFIGTSAYKQAAPVPTPAEFSAMAWSAVIHGATGVLYFPVSLSPFAFDVTPPTLVEAITKFNGEIASIDKILMNETAGGRDPYTVFRSANEGVAPKAGQLPYPFEAAEIKTETGVYRIILNLSDKAQVLDKPEWGLSNVQFQPYGVWRSEGSPATATNGVTASGSELSGTPGADTLSGTDGHDYLRGNEGNDRLMGGDSFDDLNGNMGNDTLYGGRGDDWVVGGKDQDTLYGEDGADLVLGNIGDDTVDGGVGDDILRGGKGSDSVAGGAGNDFLAGDTGDDTLAGGAGADLFHTFPDAGLDRVVDFNRAEGDRVNVLPGAEYTFAQVGLDVVVDLAGARLVLVNVQLSSLDSGWIYS